MTLRPSAQPLNKLSKTLIRSVLQWTRLPHNNLTPFQLDLQTNHSYFLRHLPSDLLQINSTKRVRHLLYLFCHSLKIQEGSKEWNELINESFQLLRYLNTESQNLSSLYQDHCYRRDLSLTIATNAATRASPDINAIGEDLTANDKDMVSVVGRASAPLQLIRVGEVVENKLLGYRGVCISWTMDQQETTPSRQLVTLLVDAYDYEQILHSSLPLQFYADEFRSVTDKRLTRIHHNLIPEYFLRYDALLGVYVPKYSLAFTHPLDSQTLLQKYSQRVSQPRSPVSRARKSYITLPGHYSPSPSLVPFVFDTPPSSSSVLSPSLSSQSLHSKSFLLRDTTKSVASPLISSSSRHTSSRPSSGSSWTSMSSPVSSPPLTN
jgi:hypothetical protein